jgi:hypothetical protein
MFYNFRYIEDNINLIIQEVVIEYHQIDHVLQTCIE